ncbi:16S rRNA (guanine(527)-N(7))-methyltransferase RsmG [Actinomyces wuliandei]|uniref:16S rRNA (guanine(527)-N(7))-methyltransferase RsmG n=1 Tax=Actinomyces wuliandei TaxID=2057743 RepID=UPI000FDADE88|nr:16S rRNA (guanine(527)-N(7))-methyltransferase RsmG [Actinomyces wuliandei]
MSSFDGGGAGCDESTLCENVFSPNGGDVAQEETSATLEVPRQDVRDFFGIAFSGAEQFAYMLAREGRVRGVIGPRELPRLWSRHLVNSAAVLPFLPRSGRVADIGSGAGFPGVVLALFRPDLDIVLVDAMDRRVKWLHDVVDELGLERVTVRHGRAEDMRDQFDVVTARAVASLPKLVHLTAPLMRSDGCLVALKGAKVEAEIDKTKQAIKKFQLSTPVIHEVALPGGGGTRVVELRRRSSP